MGNAFSRWGWKSNVFFCQFIESSAQIEPFSVIIVGTGRVFVEPQKTKFLSFHIRDDPLPPGWHNRLCTTRSNNMAFAFG